MSGKLSRRNSRRILLVEYIVINSHRYTYPNVIHLIYVIFTHTCKVQTENFSIWYFITEQSNAVVDT